MSKEAKEFCFTMVLVIAFFAGVFVWEASWQTPDDVRHYDEEPYYLSTPTPTLTEAPTASPTPSEITKMPLEATEKPRERTETPQATESPTPMPKPTEKPLRASEGIVGEKECEVNGMHSWKPWAWYTAITVVNSPQYRLQQIAKTDERGIRIVQDPNGEWRYCVALPVYWAGGTSKDIGRCVDLVMENGYTLKCVLGDTKKIEHSLRGEGKYGRKGEIIEVQVDGNKLPDIVKQMGNASYLGDDWKGEVRKVIVLDMYIGGVQ